MNGLHPLLTAPPVFAFIISFDPRDAADNGLTVDRAQALGLAYCKEHFPGHQALVCTHPDGHNHTKRRDNLRRLS